MPTNKLRCEQTAATYAFNYKSVHAIDHSASLLPIRIKRIPQPSSFSFFFLLLFTNRGFSRNVIHFSVTLKWTQISRVTVFPPSALAWVIGILYALQERVQHNICICMYRCFYETTCHHIARASKLIWAWCWSASPSSYPSRRSPHCFLALGHADWMPFLPHISTGQVIGKCAPRLNYYYNSEHIFFQPKLKRASIDDYRSSLGYYFW